MSFFIYLPTMILYFCYTRNLLKCIYVKKSSSTNYLATFLDGDFFASDVLNTTLASNMLHVQSNTWTLNYVSFYHKMHLVGQNAFSIPPVCFNLLKNQKQTSTNLHGDVERESWGSDKVNQ